MKLVTLNTYGYLHEMGVDKSKLESEGIECFAKDELSAQAYNTAVGGVKLQVKNSDYYRAKKILQLSNRNEQESCKLICPNCRSNNIDGIGIKGKFAILLFALTGKIINIFSPLYYCFDCTTQFKQEKKQLLK